MFNLRQYIQGQLPIRLLKVQTKIPIIISVVLIFLGMIFILAGEFNTSMAHLSWFQKLLMSFFHSVSSRTAGFQAMDISYFHASSLWIILILMFIGASPGSTGGGIKTTTFGVLLSSVWTNVRGLSTIELFGRTIPQKVVYKSITILIISFVTVFLFFYALLWTEIIDFFPILFETISAYSTVGYSLGVTTDISTYGKIILILLMFIGRIGPLTFAFALARKKTHPSYKYPEETLFLG